MTIARAIGALLALLLCVAAFFGYSKYRETGEWAEHSAFLALEQEIRTQLEVYRSAHETYPDSLDKLKLNYRRTDGANERMLACFDYQGSSSSFSLTPKPCPPDSVD